MPVEEKRIRYKKDGIYGTDGFGKEILVYRLPSPKVFLFRLLPLYHKLSENQMYKIEKLYDCLQPTYKKNSLTITGKMRKYIFKRDRWTCYYCGHKNQGKNEVVLQVDHKLPLSKGESNNFENLVTSCRACNLKKSDKFGDKMGDE